MSERKAIYQTVIVTAAITAGLLLGSLSLPALGEQALHDPTGALVAEDAVGRRWLEARGASRAENLAVSEKLRILTPWAERYHVPLTPSLATQVPTPGVPADSASALAELEEAIDDAVRRSVAAKSWKPMGELASWEAFLAGQGFKLTSDEPSHYIVGARHRLYRRPPRLPQAIHTFALTTREDRPQAVFGVTLRYAYPPEVAQEIQRLEHEGARYEEALALRLPAFQADRSLLEALGRQALGELWPSYRDAWGDFIGLLSDESSIASRAKVLANKNPPTIGEVWMMGETAVHLYEFGPSGRLEVLPQANALDLRGNALYGARPSEQ